MTSTRTKRENICDECGLPISICNAKAMFEQAVRRNGREAVIAAILDAQRIIRAIDVDEVLAGLRPRCAECDCEDGNCTWIKTGSAPDAVARLVEAARALVSIVEGIDGAMNHGTWRDERGVRLKDTPEWVGLYNALAAMEASHDRA